MYNIAFFRTSYVGLVTVFTLSDIGHNVICVDIAEAKVTRMRNAEPLIYEPDLDELMTQNKEE